MIKIATKRIYEPPVPEDGLRILVDRLWPRGVSKERAAVDLWAKEIAPSTELRQSFHRKSTDWDAFRQRYLQELEGQHDRLCELAALCRDRPATLLFAARDLEHNHARILADVLQEMALKRT